MKMLNKNSTNELKEFEKYWMRKIYFILFQIIHRQHIKIYKSFYVKIVLKMGFFFLLIPTSLLMNLYFRCEQITMKLGEKTPRSNVILKKKWRINNLIIYLLNNDEGNMLNESHWNLLVLETFGWLLMNYKKYENKKLKKKTFGFVLIFYKNFLVSFLAFC